MTLDNPGQYLFVYGTLQRTPDGKVHRCLTGFAEYLGEAYCHGTLYMLDGYPGLVPGDCEQGRVGGELYRLRQGDTLWVELDRYEACDAHAARPHEYARRQVEVRLLDDTDVKAWAYVYAGSLAGRAEIPGGRFQPYR